MGITAQPKTIRPGYKHTEVGVIPEDWDVKSLQSVFALKHGFAFSSEYFSDTGPVVLTPGNFRLEGGLYFEDRNTKRYSGIYAPKMTFKRGDLLIVMTDLTPDCNLLGKPAFVESDDLILHNQRIGKVVLKDKHVDVKLLFYLLLSRPYLNRIREQATGSTVRHTSNKSIYSVQMAWPSPPEQRVIATALADVDALITSLDQLTAKKRNIKQGAMQELLTGKKRLPGFATRNGYKQTGVGCIPEDWDVKTLGTSCEIVTKGTTPTSIGRAFTNTGIAFLKAETISELGKIIPDKVAYIDDATHSMLKRSQLCDGDILISIAGVLGRVGLVVNADLPANTNQALAIVRLGKNAEVERGFLFRCLRSQVIATQISNISVQAAQANISLQNVRDFLLPVPPTKAEQTAIAEVLSDMDAELAVLEQRRNKTLDIKQGMMQELLTGKTRLI